ncbi:50S ribosomal protein L29 [Wenzhouxiangella limi]|uniref:Large ribosomal subunit protein uL29 n=1 Tax=Wenzhouxiangella limi TaxID=2707351 RepID=A0A845VGT6_9GAMM|nr:50S ribosomal protein L29 [Wenzhouxiangella limi]NDY96419.1 50S ribosomal protein L29 [Wenzhouxiangella limi]
MKAAELRQKDAAELNEMLLKLRKEQFGLRIQHANGTLNNRNEMRHVRRDIARVKTVLNQLQGKSA